MLRLWATFLGALTLHALRLFAKLASAPGHPLNRGKRPCEITNPGAMGPLEHTFLPDESLGARAMQHRLSLVAPLTQIPLASHVHPPCPASTERAIRYVLMSLTTAVLWFEYPFSPCAVERKIQPKTYGALIEGAHQLGISMQLRFIAFLLTIKKLFQCATLMSSRLVIDDPSSPGGDKCPIDYGIDDTPV